MEEWKKELFETVRILKDNGVDIKTIPITKKREFVTLQDILLEESGIHKILEENEIALTFPIGKYITRYRKRYSGSVKGKLTEEENKIAEELGIVTKDTKTVQPVIMGRKITQFHLDFVEKNLDKVIAGKLIHKEVRAMLNQQAEESGNCEIKDDETIKRIVEFLLQDRPNDLEKYRLTLSQNQKRRRMYGEKRKPEVGKFEKETEEFKKKILGYLSQILNKAISIERIGEEFHTSHQTIDKIITEYLLQFGMPSIIDEYREISRSKRKGKNKQKEQEAQKKRQEVEKYEIISYAEFLNLSEEEQDKQIIMKARKQQAKIEKTTEKAALLSEEVIYKNMQKTTPFFKNQNEEDIEYFSDQDIRSIFFRQIALMGHGPDTLEEKMKVILSYNRIDKKTACEMIKKFPSILEFSKERTAEQFDLLEKESLLDYIISRPGETITSVASMYALIQFAKERYGVDDLSDVNRSGIFLTKLRLKRYGTTLAELREKYPYPGKAGEEKHEISGQDLGKITFDVRNVELCDKMQEELVCQVDARKEMEEPNVE